MTWRVASEASHPDFGFLPELVESARADAGLRLPTVGSAGLREAGRLMTDSARRLAELGGHALRTGDLGGAKAAAAAALARDPNNPQAVAVNSAIKKYNTSAPASDEPELIDDIRLLGFHTTCCGFSAKWRCTIKKYRKLSRSRRSDRPASGQEVSFLDRREEFQQLGGIDTVLRCRACWVWHRFFLV